MRKKSSILQQALLLTGVNLSLRGVGMLFQIWLSDRIGAAGLGLLQLILSVSSFAFTLGLAGVRVAAMYLCAEENGNGRDGGVRQAALVCLAYALCASTIVGAALFFGADEAARRFVGDVRAAGSLRLQALFLPVGCAGSVLAGYFTACGKIKKLAAVHVAERILSLAVTALLLLYYAGHNPGRCCIAVMLGNVLSDLAGTLFLLVLFLRAQPPVPAPDTARQMLRRVFRLSIPLALSEYLRAGLSTLEQLLIPWGLARSGSTYAASMSAYGTIGAMVFPVLMFPASLFYALSDLLVPELARCRVQNRTLRIRHLTESCLRMGFLFSGAVSGLLFVSAKPLCMLLYKSADAGAYLRIFSPMVFCLYMDAMTDGMLKGLGQQVASVRYNTLTAFLDVGLLFVLLPRLGISAYLLSFCATHLLNFGLSLHKLLSVTDYLPDGAHVFRVFFCTVISCAAGFFPAGAHLQPLFVRTAIFLPVFCVLSACTGAMSRRDAAQLRRSLRPPRGN
ncbi:MAG: polysaccharide biosynthesis C-terminal domain-containing protein [Clostridia bacterium]|nr:polysaccharide biosynthesis C-terminal domain-containing protein [Clostridia bacterium]